MVRTSRDYQVVEGNVGRRAELPRLDDRVLLDELGAKKSDSAAAGKKPAEKSSPSDTSFTPLFSQPGMAGSIAEPFTGFGSSALQPATGAASSATGLIQSATGAANLPITPQ